MAVTLVSAGTPRFRCKQLAKLPAVASDWQQVCKRPRCSHYCEGACSNPIRGTEGARCPFDDAELPLVDLDGDERIAALS